MASAVNWSVGLVCLGMGGIPCDFNHCLTGWNSFQIPHIDVQAEEREFQTSVPCVNWMKIDTFSVYFD